MKSYIGILLEVGKHSAREKGYKLYPHLYLLIFKPQEIRQVGTRDPNPPTV